MKFDGGFTVVSVAENVVTAECSAVNNDLPMVVVQEGIVDPELLDENDSPTVVQELIEEAPIVSVSVVFTFPDATGSVKVGDKINISGSTTES